MHEWTPSSVSSGLPSFDRCPVGMSQSLNIFLHRQAIRFPLWGLARRFVQSRSSQTAIAGLRRIATHHIIYRPVRSGRTAHRSRTYLLPIRCLERIIRTNAQQQPSSLGGLRLYYVSLSRRDCSPTSGIWIVGIVSPSVRGFIGRQIVAELLCGTTDNHTPDFSRDLVNFVLTSRATGLLGTICHLGA